MMLLQVDEGSLIAASQQKQLQQLQREHQQQHNQQHHQQHQQQMVVVQKAAIAGSYFTLL